MNHYNPPNNDGKEPDASFSPIEETKPRNTEAAQPATQQQLANMEHDMSSFERSTIKWARLAVVMAGVAAIFVCAQWYEMHTGGQDTHDLAVAAKLQAQKADTISESMKQAVGELKATAEATSQQLGIAQQQAKAAQDSVAAIQEQTTIARQLAQEDRRPWVGARDFECGKCTTTPKETNPNDARTPVTVEDMLFGDMSIFLENFGRTPAIDMNFSSFFGVMRTKSQPIPDYDSIVAETTPKSVPSEYVKQVEIIKNFTGLKSTVLPPNSSRKIKMPEQMMGGRRLNVPIPEQTVTYVLGRITYYGPERRKQFITNFCLMNEKGVEFRFCPTGNDMK